MAADTCHNQICNGFERFRASCRYAEFRLFEEEWKVVWEPGRWISLPFAPRGTGRKVLRAGYEYAKNRG